MPAPVASTNPFQYAVMFPALPTGMKSASGASPSASHTTGAALERRRDRYEHPAILERAGRVRAFDLEPDLRDAGLALERASADERSASFAQRETRCAFADREICRVTVDEARRARHGASWYPPIPFRRELLLPRAAAPLHARHPAHHRRGLPDRRDALARRAAGRRRRPHLHRGLGALVPAFAAREPDRRA